MSDEAVWLRIQIEARKAVAIAACGSDWRPGGAIWKAREHPSETAMVRTDAGLVVVYDEGSPTEAEAAHIALNGPRDVIARCEAELAILDEHQPLHGFDPNGPVCVTCGEDRGFGQEPAVVSYPCRTVRLLGMGYRYNKGWQEDWAAA